MSSWLRWLWPRFFISYSRSDAALVNRLVDELRANRFRVFRDTSDINPGDNFVATLLTQIKKCSAIVAVISDDYSASRWAQAELYAALTTGKMAILAVINERSLAALDDPLQRLVRDTQYAEISADGGLITASDSLARLLAAARARYRRTLVMRALVGAMVTAAVAGGVWWAVGNLNVWQERQRLNDVISQVANARGTFQHSRLPTESLGMTRRWDD